MKKTIITVATTGAFPTKKDALGVPLQPAEIAEDVYNCWKEGAAIAHIHVRDDEGRPSMSFDKFEETVRLIRAHKDCNIILNLTSAGAIKPTDEERIRPIYELRPELGTYDCGSLNWQYSIIAENPPEFLEKLGYRMQEVNVKPEIEVFDIGMIYDAKHYLDIGVLKAPMHFQFCMGCAGGIAATTKNLVLMRDAMNEVAPGSTWSAFGVGKGAMEILYAAIAMGGNVRVGMEDNVYYRKGQVAESNMQFVGRAKRLIEEFGNEVATPDEARAILDLK